MNSGLAPLDAQALVDLRALLDNARQVARSTAPAARLTAVVLLDAVCERALYIAAMALPGIPATGKEKTEDLHATVKQAIGSRWKAGAWHDVRKLHRARNAAQHEGLTFDPQLLPGWIAATEAYARTLIRAVFDIDIDQVFLSKAIQDKEVRDYLTAAENYLRDGNPDTSVRNSSNAFRLAFSDWQRQHERTHTSRMRRLPSHPDTADFRELEDLVKDTREVVAAQSFATDPGEYSWFVEIRRARPETITIDEAYRALSFVFWWVVRWEATEASLNPNRWQQHVETKRLTRDGNQPVSITTGEVKSVDQRGQFRLILNLANVPPADWYYEWSGLTVQHLSTVESCRGAGIDDIGRLIIPLDDEPDFASILAKASEAFIEAERKCVAKRTEEHDRLQRMRDESDAFEAELQSLSTTLPRWVDRLYLDPGPNLAPPRLRIALSRDAFRCRQDVEQIIRSHPSIDMCSAVDKSSALSPQMSAAGMVQALADLDEAIEDVLAEYETSIRARSNQLTLLNESLTRALRQNPSASETTGQVP